METKIYLVGTDGYEALGSEETKKQIKAVRALECGLEHEGKPLTWDEFDDPTEPKSLFQALVKDRELRIDQRIAMADRPPFAVVTAQGNRAVRLEWYEGHDALHLEYDVRAKELQGMKLSKFLREDPHAYDPSAFLEQVLGMPREFTKPILKELHKRLGKK